MHSSLPTAAAAVLLAAAAIPAQAGTPIGDYLTIGGFGTLGGVGTNTSQGKFGRDRQTGGADKRPALDVDSNLGVQVDGKATDWLSGTVQVLGAKREDRGDRALIEWAYVLVKPLDGLSIRGGRMATPTFLISDSRNIGYANNWVRAPNEVYALNFLSNFDGGDITYRKALGPASVSVTGMAGKTTFRTLHNKVDADDLRGLNLLVDTDWVTLRAGRVRADISVPAINQTGDRYTFTGYGLTVDRNNVFAQAEFVQRRSIKQAAVLGANGWYVMGGYRFGTMLPYAIVSRSAPIDNSVKVHAQGTQSTKALGVRWDAFKSADLKLQVERINTNGTPGMSFTTAVVPSKVPGPPLQSSITGDVTAVSVAVDFTF